MSITALIEKCSARSSALAAQLRSGGERTVGEWIAQEREKLRANSRLAAPERREDFLAVCGDYVRRRLGEAAADAAVDALSRGAMHTADHFGGLYSSQSFQGDLFFMELLREEKPRAVPVFAFGCVSVSSSTFARGLLAYTDAAQVQKLPVLPVSHTNTPASLIGPLDAEMVNRTLRRVEKDLAGSPVRDAAAAVLREDYAAPELSAWNRFADQVPFLGRALFSRLEKLTGGVPFVFLEAEAVFAEAFLADFARPDSLLSVLLRDDRFLQALSKAKDSDGIPLTELLFWGVDSKMHLFRLNLEPEGCLRGQSADGETVLPLETETLREALRSRRVLPGLYLGWLMTGLLRGFTWYGGIFQSAYLPAYCSLTAGALRDSGYGDLAALAESLDFSGYISGPAVALSPAGVQAGPLEFIAAGVDSARFEALLRTPLRDAHAMGMFEFYQDMVPSKERLPDWFAALSAHCRAQYPDNILYGQGC